MWLTEIHLTKGEKEQFQLRWTGKTSRETGSELPVICRCVLISTFSAAAYLNSFSPSRQGASVERDSLPARCRAAKAPCLSLGGTRAAALSLSREFSRWETLGTATGHTACRASVQPTSVKVVRLHKTRWVSAARHRTAQERVRFAARRSAWWKLLSGRLQLGIWILIQELERGSGGCPNVRLLHVVEHRARLELEKMLQQLKKWFISIFLN